MVVTAQPKIRFNSAHGNSTSDSSIAQVTASAKTYGLQRAAYLRCTTKLLTCGLICLDLCGSRQNCLESLKVCTLKEAEQLTQRASSCLLRVRNSKCLLGMWRCGCRNTQTRPRHSAPLLAVPSTTYYDVCRLPGMNFYCGWTSLGSSSWFWGPSLCCLIRAFVAGLCYTVRSVCKVGVWSRWTEPLLPLCRHVSGN